MAVGVLHVLDVGEQVVEGGHGDDALRVGGDGVQLLGAQGRPDTHCDSVDPRLLQARRLNLSVARVSGLAVRQQHQHLATAMRVSGYGDEFG